MATIIQMGFVGGIWVAVTSIENDVDVSPLDAKIAGIKLCESYNRQYKTDFRSIMPTNLYGINDNFHPKNSHVIPALMRRFHEAKTNNDEEVIIWGTGNARREFLYVDDMAKASIFVLDLDKKTYQANTRPM